MLGDIETGRIECIVVKDLSRIGRDFLSTSYYIEEYFPSKKVRFVSVNDHFETIDGINNLEQETSSRVRIPITNAFNEQVSLDIQKKMRSALDIKAKRGMFIGPRAPFGYRKSADDHFKLEVDSEAAEIVKLIFSMAADGVNTNTIVCYLNQNSILTPIQYARIKGLQGNYDNGDGTWNTRSVKYILTNRTYTGVLVQGREKRIVEGTHPALEDTETFDRIQTGLQRRAFKFTDVENKPSTPNILKGKVICGCCGSKMQRRRGTNHASWYFFTCLTNNRVGADRCTGMYVREEDIFSAIYYQLKLFVKANIDFSVGYQGKKAALEQEIAELQEMLSDPMECTRTLYERFVRKEIDKDTYFVERAKVYAAKKRLENARHELGIHGQRYQQLCRMRQALNKELPLDEIMDSIESITINEGRRIEVNWREIY
jgi:DNA invertase Pin-like site-specific DNA recombinase